MKERPTSVVVFVLFLLASLWTVAEGGYIPNSNEPHFGDGHLHILNQKTGEELNVIYRYPWGQYNQVKVEEIRNLLRCQLTGKISEIPVELIEVVDQIQDHFNVPTVAVISGYRSPRLNEMLRRQGRRAAKHSYHMKGLAIDLRLPGVKTRSLRDYARKLHVGGVGYYPQSRFVHVDLGPVRYW
ncbi:MAG: DUF882 domain-containing protein [bacterium]|nr:DUF882 domain-containing protein [bacterium]